MLNLRQVGEILQEYNYVQLGKVYQQLQNQENLSEVVVSLKSQLSQLFKHQKRIDARLLQPSGDQDDVNQESITLLLLAVSYYYQNCYTQSQLIAMFSLTQERNGWICLEFNWILIVSLQKQNQLEDCLVQIDTMIQLATNYQEESLSQLINILQQKKAYIIEFIANKREHLVKLEDSDKAEMGKRVLELIERQESSNYFEQEGMPAYLISSEWMSRWKSFTKFNAQQDADAIQSKDVQLNVYSQEEYMDDETLIELLRSQCSAELLEKLENVCNRKDNGTLMCPIWNDDLIDPMVLVEQDPHKFKQYTNYRLKSNIRESQDYFFMAAYVWKELYDNFGGSEIKRIVIRRSETKCQVETQLKEINYILFPNSKESLQLVLVNSNELVGDLIDKLGRIVNGKIRNIWKPTELLDFKVLLQTQIIDGRLLNKDINVENSQIGQDDILIVELEHEKFKLTLRASEVQQKQLLNKCNCCSEVNQQLYFCECLTVKYCDRICQNKDRKLHEQECKKILNKDQYLVEQAKKYKVRPPAQLSRNSSNGICGLSNLGNTCFMNSSLQCLSQVFELTEYFIYNDFVQDLNDKNPLGTNGRLACAYSELLKELWESSSNSVSPWNLKNVIGNGYSQQDSQELLSYLLDLLHEDLNKVKKKPYVPEVDYKGQPDSELASIYWNHHISRNNSIITKLFTGQLKSKVECPDCKFVSITFDPFVSVSLPIPNKEYLLFTFYFVYRDSNKLPLKISLSQLSTITMQEIIKYVAQAKAIDPICLNFYFLHENSIERQVNRSSTVKQVKETSSMCFLYEEYDKEFDYAIKDINEPTYFKIYVNILEMLSKKGYDQKTIPQKISFTRLLYIQKKSTYFDLQIKIYQILKTYLLLLIEPGSHSVLPIQLEQFLKSIKKHTYADIIQEYKAFLQLTDNIALPYQTYEQFPDKIIGGTHEQLKYTQPIINVSLIVSNYIRSDALRLNRCQDSDINQLDANSGSTQCSILDCFSYFQQEEILGVGDEWYCSKCKAHKRASKKMEIYNAPNILILHLKRFKQSRVYSYGQYFYSGGSSKITSFVDYPIVNLNLSQYVLNKDPSINQNYDLFAVSNHFGGMGGGHYTAYGKNAFNNQWFDFNDSSVRELRQSPVSDSAYVLFYRRKSDRVPKMSK